MAKEEEIDELKNLTVEDRIRKLKELEQKKKEEIQKAQDMLKKSEEELEHKENERKQIPIPQLRAVDVSQLFTEEEKQIFGTKRFSQKSVAKKETETPLEETVATEQAKMPEVMNLAEQQYRVQLSKEPTKQLYTEIKSLYQEIQDKGYVNTEERQKIENIQYAMNKKREDIEAGSYNPNQYVSIALNKSQELADKIKKMYRG
jgi:hypothetical protein